MPNIINVTQGKPATASSYVTPYAPSRAVNGTMDKYSRWLCASSGTCWLSVDLRGCYKITYWGITSIGAANWDVTCNLNSFKVQGFRAYGPNPGWFDIDTINDNISNKVDHNLQTPVTANSLRVYVGRGDSRPYSTTASIIEFVALGYLASNNANLSNLAISSGTLAPTFSSSTTTYVAQVPNNITGITITPTAEDTDATIAVNNQFVVSGAASQLINLDVGSNFIKVDVVSPDSTNCKSYSVTVIRSGNAYLSNLTLSNASLSPLFNENINSYTAEVDNSVTSITVTPTAQDTTSIIYIYGAVVPSGSASQAIDLVIGTNAITVLVQSIAGDSMAYTVTVTRADAAVFISSLVLKASDGTVIPLNTDFSKDILSYTASIGDANTSINVIATSSDAATNVSINGMIVPSGQAVSINQLGVGITNITATLVGTSKVYTVALTRASSPYLTDLVLVNSSDGSVIGFTPVFNPTTNSYNAKVAVANVAVIPTAEDASGAVITVNNVTVASGTQSAAFAVRTKPQSTLISVKVTSDNGNIFQYSIRVSK